MRTKLVGVTLAVAVALLTIAPGATAARPSLGVTTVNLVGQDCTIPGTGDGTVTAGTLTLDRFTTQAGELAANVTVTATCAVETATGTVTQTRTRQLTVPIDLGGFAGPGSCEILDLVLGPLDLDLLGLVVHLDQVHLNITAEQGPGNLLGNLLCALAGALDANAPANQIANLLNQILAILQ
jgi:hypothetical protein